MPDSPTTARAVSAPLDGLGLATGVGAYVLWGVLPLYFPLLQPAGAVEIIAHRVVWSLLFCFVLLAATRTWGAFVTALRNRRTLGILSVAAVLLAVNWLVFVFGILTDRVVDAALGYYINPLVTVTLAVVVLRERLRTVQWVALGFGAAAVVVITAGYGQLPWIALVLALSLRVLRPDQEPRRPHRRSRARARRRDPRPRSGRPRLPGLDERRSGQGTFETEGLGHALILASSGIVTAIPLLLFNSAARRLPLSMLGLLQYIAPTLQLLIGVLVLHEQMPAARWWGFALVWTALGILTVDGVRTSRAQRLSRRASAGQRGMSVASRTIAVTLSWPPAASAAATRRSAAA